MEFCDSLINEPCFGSGVINIGWHRVGHGLQFKSRLQSIFRIQYRWGLCKVCFLPKILDKMYSFHRNPPMQYEIDGYERDLSILKTKLSQAPDEHKQQKIVLVGKIRELEEKLSKYTHCSEDEKSAWDDSIEKSSNGLIPASVVKIITDYLSAWSDIDVYENKDLIELVKSGDVFTNETESALRFVTKNNEFHIPANYALDDCNICMKHPHLILSHSMKEKMLHRRKNSNGRSKKKFLHRPLKQYSCDKLSWKSAFDLPPPKCGGDKYIHIGEFRYVCPKCNPDDMPLDTSKIGLADPIIHHHMDFIGSEIKRPLRRTPEGNRKHWKDL